MTHLAEIPYPVIDPILLDFGAVKVRWYGVTYIIAFILAALVLRGLSRRGRFPVEEDRVIDVLFWGILGVFLGGRIGYFAFYGDGQPLWHIVKVWDGGMSFHGGLLGVIAAIVLFTRKRAIPLFAFGDLVACAAPIGLLLGRLANFVNGELYGRASDVAWAVAFPAGGGIGRHPSQLYEAALEGLALFALLFVLHRWTRLRYRSGALTGIFFAGYGCARFAVEFFREPDAHLGFLFAGATMGQLLSLPLIAAGIALIGWAYHRPSLADTPPVGAVTHAGPPPRRSRK